MNKIILILVFSFASVLVGQNFPTSYSLNEAVLNKTTLNKTSGKTPLSNSISKIVTVNDTIWLGTSKGLTVSYDNGANWKDYYNNEAFGQESISALGYYESIIWAATGHLETLSDNDVNTGSGIRFSLDGGKTWQVIPQPVDDSGDSLLTYGINTIRALPVTVPQQNIIWDLSFTPNKIWISSWAGGTRWNYIDSLIIDPGRKWNRVILPPDNLKSIKPSDTLSFALQNARGKFGNEENLNHMGFSVLGVSEEVVFCGTAGGLNKSVDGGISWEKFNHQNQQSPISGNWIIDITRDTINNNIWATTWKANGESEFDGLSKTTDDGNTWTTYLNNEKIYYHGYKYFEDESEIFIPSTSGIFRSSNQGITWLKNPSIKDSETSLKLLTNTFYAVSANIDNQGNSLIWIGTNDGLVRLTEEEAGNWNGDWKVYISSPEISKSSKSIAFPNPFSPDTELIKIKYKFSGGSKNVTLRIFDFGMNLVRTVLQNVERFGGNDYLENWNGKDENNTIVPNGVYFYRIDIGNDEPLYGKIIVLL